MGALHAAGKSRDAGERRSRDATIYTLITPPHCDWKWKRYWRSGQPDGGEPDRECEMPCGTWQVGAFAIYTFRKTTKIQFTF